MLQTAPEHQAVAEGRGQFEYRPIPMSAPVSMVLGLLSLLAPIVLYSMGVEPMGLAFFMMMSLLAVLLGLFSLKTIRRSHGAYSGRYLSVIGVVAAVGSILASTAVAAVLVAEDVPEGYRAINFTRDISKKDFVRDSGTLAIHPDVAALDGKEIYIKGYMYRSKTRTKNLTSFTFVKDNLQCCFGRQPNQTDMIDVYMQDGLNVDLENALVGVAGVFRIRNPDSTSELGTKPVYRIDAKVFKTARVNF